jgi:glycosyltransferase involved in cell wall biosynthesis
VKTIARTGAIFAHGRGRRGASADTVPAVSRVLVLTSEPVGESMAGPAIRAFELARVLREAGHDVRLESAGDRGEARALAARHDVVVVQGWVLERAPGIAGTGARLVVDLYDPFALELLMLLEDRPLAEREVAQANALRALREQMRAGDFFLCASERQRDYWLGWLEACGRVSPRTHAADPSLRALLDVVPFGVPAAPPAPSGGPGPRAAFGLGADDVVLLWGGGVYDWLDPVTVVRAVNRLEGPHLVFMASGHPNPGQPASQALAAARREAGERVHFNQGWVPYDRRADWLLDADVGVTAHADHVEARFAFRTRVLDYLWAGRPVACTGGDALAEEVQRRDLGAVLAPGDVDGWTRALRELAADPARRAAAGERSAGFARELRWERAAAPLLAFCATPRAAPDLAAGGPLPEPRERPLSRRRLGALARRLGLR